MGSIRLYVACLAFFWLFQPSLTAPPIIRSVPFTLSSPGICDERHVEASGGFRSDGRGLLRREPERRPSPLPSCFAKFRQDTAATGLNPQPRCSIVIGPRSQVIGRFDQHQTAFSIAPMLISITEPGENFVNFWARPRLGRRERGFVLSTNQTFGALGCSMSQRSFIALRTPMHCNAWASDHRHAIGRRGCAGRMPAPLEDACTTGRTVVTHHACGCRSRRASPGPLPTGSRDD
jgi:hypothetical protein